MNFIRLIIMAGVFILFISGIDAGEVTGSFRLEHAEYCVGEPILVEFTVTNGSETDFSFDVGGDYSGALRHERFSFEVTDEAGQNFNHKSLGSYLEGPGTTIILAPGEKYLSYQLMSSYVHLLTPGKYNVACSTKLSLDSYNKQDVSKQTPAVTISEKLKFKIIEYDRNRINESIQEMKKTERIEDRSIKKFWVGKPLGWALYDLSNKLQLGVTHFMRDDELMTAVLAALPERWDVHFYLEYDMKSNRNWLTADKPEEFRLTFSVRNNSTHELPHGLNNSTLSVDGTSLSEWQDVLKKMLSDAGIGDTVKPGETIEISGKFNDFLKPKPEPQILVWKIDKITKSADVRFRERKGNSEMQ